MHVMYTYMYIVSVCRGECLFFVQLVRGVEVVLGEGSGCSVETRLDTRERFIPLLLDKYKVRERIGRERRWEIHVHTCTSYLLLPYYTIGNLLIVEKQLPKGIGEFKFGDLNAL